MRRPVLLRWLLGGLLLAVVAVVVAIVFSGPNLRTPPRLVIEKADLRPGETYELEDVAEGAKVAVRLAYTRKGRTNLADKTWSYVVQYEALGEQHRLAIRAAAEGERSVHEAVRLHDASGGDFEIEVVSIEGRDVSPRDIVLVLEETSAPRPATDLPAPKDISVEAGGRVSWAPSATRAAYEVQWMFVDADDDEQAPPIEGRPTGTTEVAGPEARLDFGYATGSVYVRIRTLSPGLWGEGTLRKGPWSAPVKHVLDAAAALDEGRSYWRTVSLDNQGTSRSTVHHYDALLRQRQQVDTSRPGGDTSKRRTRVTETVLDDEGRASLSTLPIPVDGDSLRYRPDFALAAATSERLRPGDLRSGVPPPLKQSGAGGYFVARDDFEGVPEDASPYTTARFARDLRSRKARDFGAGSQLHKHPSMFMTGGVEAEFRQMFGSTAGLSSSYTREVSVDPNSQGHVRYTDPDGNLVAVGLVGRAPDSLDALPENPLANGSAKVLRTTIDIPDTSLDPGHLVDEYVHTITNGEPTSYTFAYSLTSLTTSVTLPNDAPVCPTCKYDVEITVLGPDGAPVRCDDSVTTKCVEVLSAGAGIPTREARFAMRVPPPAGPACDGTDELTFTIELTQPGEEYKVVRAVRLDRSTVDEYVAEHVHEMPGTPDKESVREEVGPEATPTCALETCSGPTCPGLSNAMRDAALAECRGYRDAAPLQAREQAEDLPSVSPADLPEDVCTATLPDEMTRPSGCCHAAKCTSNVDATVASRLWEVRFGALQTWTEANAQGYLDPLALGAPTGLFGGPSPTAADLPAGITTCTSNTCRDPAFRHPSLTLSGVPFLAGTAARAEMRQHLLTYGNNVCSVPEDDKLNLWDYVRQQPPFFFDEQTQWALFRGAYLARRAQVLHAHRGHNCAYDEYIPEPSFQWNGMEGAAQVASIQSVMDQHCAEQCEANVCNWRWQLAELPATPPSPPCPTPPCPALPQPPGPFCDYNPFDVDGEPGYDSSPYLCDEETPTDDVHTNLLDYCKSNCGELNPLGTFRAEDIGADQHLAAAQAAAGCSLEPLAGGLIESTLVCRESCPFGSALTACGELLAWYLPNLPLRASDPEEFRRRASRQRTTCRALVIRGTDVATRGTCRYWLVDESGKAVSLDEATGGASVTNPPPATMPTAQQILFTGMSMETSSGLAYVLSNCDDLVADTGTCCGGTPPSGEYVTPEECPAFDEPWQIPDSTGASFVPSLESSVACAQPSRDPPILPRGECAQELVLNLDNLLTHEPQAVPEQCVVGPTAAGTLLQLQLSARGQAEYHTKYPYCWFELLGEKGQPWFETGWTIAGIEHADLPQGFPETRQHQGANGSVEFSAPYSGLRLTLRRLSDGADLTVYLYGTCPIPLGPECDLVGGEYTSGLDPVDPGAWETQCEDDAEEAVDIQVELLVEQGVDDAVDTLTETMLAHCMGGALNETFTVQRAAAEYAHTLFYYDQVGNLTTVVPPNGVDRLPVDDDGDMDATAVPDHKMLTRVWYDSRNNVVERRHPDIGAEPQSGSGELEGTTRLIYDQRGRRRFSQTPEQATRAEWSYARYDGLDRMEESGVVAGFTYEEIKGRADDTTFPRAGVPRSEVVATSYGPAPPLEPADDGARASAAEELRRYLRGRVRSVDARASQTSLAYSYAPSGEVREQRTATADLGTKLARYEHDPVDDALLAVTYQEGEEDELRQRFEYDSERRLERADSSTNGVLWDSDARLSYYKHGPLKRRVLGEDGVQGLDYVHTIAGWPKAVNAGDASVDRDPSKDGSSGDAGAPAQDVVGLLYTYFDGDFAPADADFMSGDTGAGQVLARDGPGLYTGIIKHRLLTHRGLPSAESTRSTYKYDQLSRLTASDAFAKSSASPDFSTRHAYDINGNITTVTRDGAQRGTCAGRFDELAYAYQPSTNRLLHVADALAPEACDSDLDDQGAFNSADLASANYGYDLAGRLVRDRAEDIEDVTWSSTDKVLAFERGGSTAVELAYDGLDRRVRKRAGTTTDHYIRHPDGRILATYKAKAGEPIKVEQVLYAGATRLGTRTPQEATPDGVFERSPGFVRYELTDQVGSVLAVVSDEKVGHDDDGDGLADRYTATTLSAADYYPFGMLKPGRELAFTGTRFGFAGYEKDDELKGLGGSYVTDARFYDPRVGRWLGPDPLFLRTTLVDQSLRTLCATSPGECANRFAYAKNDPVQHRDRTGEWVGIDDAAFIAGGAAIGVFGQGISDLFRGELSSWHSYVGAGFGGAAAGETLLYTANPILAGAAGGLVGSTTREVLEASSRGSDETLGDHVAEVVIETGLGAASGLIPGARATAGSSAQVFKQMVTKLSQGTAKSLRPQTAVKMLIGGAGVSNALTGAVAVPFVDAQIDGARDEE